MEFVDAHITIWRFYVPCGPYIRFPPTSRLPWKDGDRINPKVEFSLVEVEGIGDGYRVSYRTSMMLIFRIY